MQFNSGKERLFSPASFSEFHSRRSTRTVLAQGKAAGQPRSWSCVSSGETVAIAAAPTARGSSEGQFGDEHAMRSGRERQPTVLARGSNVTKRLADSVRQWPSAPASRGLPRPAHEQCLTLQAGSRQLDKMNGQGAINQPLLLHSHLLANCENSDNLTPRSMVNVGVSSTASRTYF